MVRERETFSCPQCGDDVPVGSAACPSCGSDDRTGWATDDDAESVRAAQDLDLPETHLDDDRYDEFVREDLESGTIRTTPPSRTAIVMIVAFVLAVAALLAWLTTAPK